MWLTAFESGVSVRWGRGARVQPYGVAGTELARVRVATRFAVDGTPVAVSAFGSMRHGLGVRY